MPIGELLDYGAVDNRNHLAGYGRGFGSLLAIFAFPEIRAYNRISIYLAFFCLLVVALLIDRVIGSRIKSRNAYLFYCVGMGILLVFGLLDETARSFAHDYKSLRLRFANDKQFVKSIERALTPGSMIFQLPYASFPESSPTFRMTAYDPCWLPAFQDASMELRRDDRWEGRCVAETCCGRTAAGDAKRWHW